MLGTGLRGLFILILTWQLSACGGSDDKEDSKKYDKPYLQFYNGSGGSGSVFLSVDEGSSAGSAVYGDATSLLTLDDNDVDLTFTEQDNDGVTHTLEELSVKVATGHKMLVVLSGQDSATTFNTYEIERTELDKRFRLFATSVLTSDQDYDVYLGESGSSFANAHLLATVSADELEQFDSWQTEDTSSFSQGEYQVYLTLPGEATPVFESSAIAFNYATEYTMIIRASSGAIKNNLEVDLVINSSSVNKYTSTDEAAQYRIYNSLEERDVIVDVNGGQDNQQQVTVPANAISDFRAIVFGDYQLSGKVSDDDNLAFSNRLLTLSQGRSNAIVIYQDEEQNLVSLNFEESNLPQSVEHDIQVVNVNPDYDDLDIFFVRQNETISTAKYRTQNLAFEHSARLTIKSGQYEIVMVHNDENNSPLLLARSEMLEIDQDVNYIVSLQASALSPSGYKIVLLH